MGTSSGVQAAGKCLLGRQARIRAPHLRGATGLLQYFADRTGLYGLVRAKKTLPPQETRSHCKAQAPFNENHAASANSANRKDGPGADAPLRLGYALLQVPAATQNRPTRAPSHLGCNFSQFFAEKPRYTALNRDKKTRPDGFSLIELLVVMALILILFTMYWSSGSKNFQLKQMTQCSKNLQFIHLALRTYASDNNDRLPQLDTAKTSEPVLSQLVPRSTTSTEYFTCPGCKDSPLPDGQPFADGRISYAYYMGHKLTDGADQPLLSDRQVNNDPKLAGQLLFSPDGKKPGANHNKYGGNVLFCDGNVQQSDSKAAFNLTNAPNVVLLNPKP